MIKQARTTMTVKDSNNKGFPTVQITYLKRIPSPTKVAEAYGTHGSAPKDTACLLICIGGEDNKYVIPLSAQTRPTGLKEGEYVTGNFLVGNVIYFDEAGKITVDAAEITLGRTLLEFIVKATKLVTYLTSEVVNKFNPHKHPVTAVGTLNPLLVGTPVFYVAAIAGTTGTPDTTMTAPTETNIASDKHLVGE